MAVEKHGHTKRSLPGGRTRLYVAWQNMRTRCNNPKDRCYAYYGGRGIRVCAEWSHSFEAFSRDMGEHPGPGYSLERIDGSADYGPSNCRWALASEQSRNKRNNVLLTLKGPTMCIADWSRETGLSQARIAQRITAGWSHERALTTKPIRKRQ